MLPADITSVQPESFGPFVGAPTVESRQQVQDGHQTFSRNFALLAKRSSHVLMVNHIIGKLAAWREQPAPQASQQSLLAATIEGALEEVHQLRRRVTGSEVD